MKVRIAYPVKLNIQSFEERLRNKYTIVYSWPDHDKLWYDIDLKQDTVADFKAYIGNSIKEGFIEEDSAGILDHIQELVKLEEPIPATFRNEFAWDNLRVHDLLWSLGYHQGAWWTDGEGSSAVTFYTIVLTHETVEDLGKRMKTLIDSNDRYGNLHRCYETLAEGRTGKDPHK